jgi:hypothetical protein
VKFYQRNSFENADICVQRKVTNFSNPFPAAQLAEFEREQDLGAADFLQRLRFLVFSPYARTHTHAEGYKIICRLDNKM